MSLKQYIEAGNKYLGWREVYMYPNQSLAKRMAQ